MRLLVLIYKNRWYKLPLILIIPYVCTIYAMFIIVYLFNCLGHYHTLTLRTRFHLNLQHFYLKKHRIKTISVENFILIGFRGFGKKFPRGTLVPRSTHLHKRCQERDRQIKKDDISNTHKSTDQSRPTIVVGIKIIFY
jgi:hypothetical protein